MKSSPWTTRSAALTQVVLACAACVWADARPARAQARTAEAINASAQVSAELAAAVFDSAWLRIRRAHYDSTFGGLDWDAVRAELRPRAQQARRTAELRAVIRDMLARLGESHYTLIPREVADALDAGGSVVTEGAPGDVGLELRVAEGLVVVTEVEADGPAAASGVRSGWVVESIDTVDLSRALRALQDVVDAPGRGRSLGRFLWNANGLLDGPAGSTVRLALRDGDDRAVQLELRRRVQPGEPVRLGNLPTLLAQLQARRLDGAGGCIGLIRFNVWMIPVARQFDRAMDDLRGCGGMIVDLRGNPGGVAGMLMGFAGHFLDDRVPLGVMRSRTGELRFVANPRRVSAAGQAVRPFAGPLAVLVDAMTASTSEFFAGGMQAIGRARVFGDTTAGQALPAVVSRLPNDDVLMYVVADYSAPDGRRFEGGGVRPDVTVQLRRGDLLDGNDPVLQAALEWFAGSSGRGGTGSPPGNRGR